MKIKKYLFLTLILLTNFNLKKNYAMQDNSLSIKPIIDLINIIKENIRLKNQVVKDLRVNSKQSQDQLQEAKALIAQLEQTLEEFRRQNQALQEQFGSNRQKEDELVDLAFDQYQEIQQYQADFDNLLHNMNNEVDRQVLKKIKQRFQVYWHTIQKDHEEKQALQRRYDDLVRTGKRLGLKLSPGGFIR